MAEQTQPWSAQSITMKKTDALKPSERNARTHSDEQIKQIAASITEWGFTTPILITESDEIIAGHGRARAALSLSMNEVPTITATDWTPEQIRAYIIADNKLALNAGWDQEILSAELISLDEFGFDLKTIGFSNDEFEKYTGQRELPPENTYYGDDRLLVIVEFTMQQETEHAALFEELNGRGLTVKITS